MPSRGPLDADTLLSSDVAAVISRHLEGSPRRSASTGPCRPAFHGHLIPHQATRLTSAPFRAQTQCSGMRPVIRQRPCSEGPVTCSRFPVAFRLPPFASWPSCPATDLRLPHGRPTGDWSSPPDHDGVSMFRTGESRPVSGAPYTPGPWYSHGRHRNSGHHCHLSTAGPVSPVRRPISGALGNEAYRGSHHSPFRSFPCL